MAAVVVFVGHKRFPRSRLYAIAGGFVVCLLGGLFDPPVRYFLLVLGGLGVMGGIFLGKGGVLDP